MIDQKTLIVVLVSSCPDTSGAKWKPNNGDACGACPDSLLVKIVPEKGRASSVFRYVNPQACALNGEGNPYSFWGDLVQAHTGMSKYDVSICVARNISGNLWNHWNGKRTGADILKRSKYKGKLATRPTTVDTDSEPLGRKRNGCEGGSALRAFSVYLCGEEIDKVFYGHDCNVDADEVRESLINHDGYSPNISVEEEA